MPPQGGRKHPQQEYIQINTKDILFVCGGAFDGLDKIIEARTGRRQIGFSKEEVETGKAIALQQNPYLDVEPDDLPVWLPYVRGERTPLHRPDLRSSLHDAALHHDSAHLLRAAYEAAGFVVRHHLDLARPAGLVPRRIVAAGGGTQSEAWMQALADCTDLPVEVVAVPEGAALGSAFVARCVAGLEPNMTDARRWARTTRAVEPRPDWVAASQPRYERFRALTSEAVDRG